MLLEPDRLGVAEFVLVNHALSFLEESFWDAIVVQFGVPSSSALLQVLDRLVSLHSSNLIQVTLACET